MLWLLLFKVESSYRNFESHWSSRQSNKKPMKKEADREGGYLRPLPTNPGLYPEPCILNVTKDHLCEKHKGIHLLCIITTTK